MQVRKAIAAVAAGFACAAGVMAATTAPKKKTTATKATTAPATAPKKASPAVPSAHKIRGARVASNKKAPAHATHSTWRNAQLTPGPDRYREIQEALAKKGYLHGQPDGVWNQDSVDALRRFQQDQNLEANGKLDSLSIIALGLGPKY